MKISYPIPSGENKIELEIKRSKFIAYAINATDREQADAFVKHLKNTNPRANHVCWAYIAGSPETTERSMSDDGEPSGTAGMPMLKVLQYSGLGDIAVAVVRYFGGTKLGTGGLQRAYSDAVVQVLEDLPLTLKVSRLQLRIEYDYSFQGAISRLLQHYAVQELVETYHSSVINSFAVAVTEASALEAELINITSDNIVVCRPDE
nr:YigZ family protein [uncultured Glaciecola sp.]